MSDRGVRTVFPLLSQNDRNLYPIFVTTKVLRSETPFFDRPKTLKSHNVK